MIKTTGIWVSLGVTILTIGCQSIAGIEDRDLIDSQQIPPDVCVLPSSGTGGMRVGNLVPSLGRVDYCIKPAAATFAGVKPLLRSAGTSCPKGLAYQDLTVGFRLESGVYDVRTVAPDASTCDGSFLAEVDQVVVKDNETVSVLLFGPDLETGATLKSLPESKPAPSLVSIRFIHALVGSTALDVGLADQAQLPSTILSLAFANVPFTSAAPAATTGIGKIDANGYLTLSSAGAMLQFAAAPTGKTDAILAMGHAWTNNSAVTLFATGTVSDVRFPPELIACNEGGATGVLANCSMGAPLDVRLEAHTLNAYGAAAPFITERLPAIVDQAGKKDADIVCLMDLAGADNLKAVVGSASAAFPYAYYVEPAADVAFSDPKDQSGAIPVPYATGACEGVEKEADAFLDCGRDKCSPTPGSEDTIFDPPTVQCLSSKCTAQALALLKNDLQLQRCWSCLTWTETTGYTVGFTRSDCRKYKGMTPGFRSFAGDVILSRWPIEEKEVFYLPSTDFMAAMLRAGVRLPNGALLDVYCGDSSNTTGGITRPYSGNYGTGKAGIDGWKAEQAYQVKQTTAFIQDRSVRLRRRAVFLNTFYAGPAFGDSVSAYNPEAYSALVQNFPDAVPADYTPVCNNCANNPMTNPPGTEIPAGTPSTWETHIMLSGIPVTQVRSAGLGSTEATVDVTKDNASYKVPISQYYPFKATVGVRP